MLGFWPGSSPDPAGPGELDLTWSAEGGSCEGAGQIRIRVETLLGRPLRGNLEATVVARGEIAGDGGGWTLSLDLQTPHGRSHRTFDAETCVTLVQVAALFLALAVDPLAVTQTQSRPPSSGAVPEPKSESEPVPVDAEPGTSVVRSELRAGPDVGMGFVAGPSLGGLPGVAIAFGADGSVTWPRFRLVFGGRYLPDRTARDARAPGVGLEIRQGSGNVRGCPVLRPGHELTFPLCLGVEVGAQSALAFGVRDAARRTSLWLAATGGVGLVWKPGPHLAAVVHAHAIVPLVRPGFGIANLGELHRVRPIGMAAGVGVEARIPTRVRPRRARGRRRRENDGG